MNSTIKITSLENPETDGYVTEDGRTVAREYGVTPSGLEARGRWVYRDFAGTFIDMDRYRHDLFEHNCLREV